ncbi:MAG TPA: hypothetical protein DCS07_05060 [Bdellovibrionales bacterium]|nr:MAG: hypothetical protein A2Z97_16115 [Bdellovibrionales bacterium GWB1_52_6]OFZ05046.1 MAG: hypothetical protein A2X97_00435 [Bdellovibrionales bacterium GWA1_52_35]OFZ37241.1 MAG: hypothetical protein A2070_07075 [Bdellovibrionales bacterium GWC1_52_8]HAR41989.1 hypothetical protein [Bdellovibrionales bacterium]HCM41282.1 hypothetical protein [Bdellovibrionales bacterium]
MSPKAAPKKAPKKPVVVKESKKAKAEKPSKGKAAKAAKVEEALPADPLAMSDAEREELEEQQEEAAASAGQNSSAAALAAASGPTEMSASFKNFRHHPDMENFYRFIYENDLRHEALAIIDEIMRDKQEKKKLGKPIRNA